MPSYFFDISQVSSSTLDLTLPELKNLQSIQVHCLDNILDQYPSPQAVLVSNHSNVEILFQIIKRHPGIQLFYINPLSPTEQVSSIATLDESISKLNITPESTDRLQQNSTAKHDIDGQLRKIFLLTSWSNSKENQQEVERLAQSIRNISGNDPILESQILSSIDDGKYAYRLVNVELQAHIKKFGNSPEQLQQWLEQTLATFQDKPRICKHLKTTLKKQMKKADSNKKNRIK